MIASKIVFTFCCLIVSFTFFNISVFANSAVNTSAAVSGYTFPDETGSTNLTKEIPQVIVTSQTQPVTVTVAEETTNPTINLNSLCLGGTVTPPTITVISANALNVQLTIPPDDLISSTNLSWNCVLPLPIISTVVLPVNAGETKTLGTVIEIGFADSKLFFGKAVRLVFPNELGNRVGYSRGGVFTEITSFCSADTQVAGDALGIEGNCKINSGNDLVVWTKHFTVFATFSSTMDAVSHSTHHSTSGTIPTPTPTPISTSTSRVPSYNAYLATTPTPTISGLKLFDIVLLIENVSLKKSNDLIATTQFTSFGIVPTLVNLAYRIENASGAVVYTSQDSTTVETEKFITKDFTDLNIGAGKYTLFLVTTYGNNVRDEFHQPFEVASSSFFSGTQITFIWIFVFVLVVFVVVDVCYLIRRRKIREY